AIHPDLTASANITQAKRLKENADLAFMGVTPAGSFDISGDTARKMLAANNATGRSNSEVVRHYCNAENLVKHRQDIWTIDFGTEMSESEAAQYEMPFEYVKTYVRPERMKSKQPEREKQMWWIYTRSRPEMRAALKPLSRYIATPMVAKHRIYVWLTPDIVP